MEYTMHRKRCDDKEERRETSKIEDRHDMEWRVEQKLARVLAERDIYVDGFLYGFLTALVVAVIVGYALFPERFARKV